MPPALPLQAALGTITVRIPRRYHCAALPLQATLGATTARRPQQHSPGRFLEP